MTVADAVTIAVSVVDIVLLWQIRSDGRKMLWHEASVDTTSQKTYLLYEKYFERRELERVARNEARRKVRAAKQSPLDAPPQPES